jgi:multicomponent K+:H+ antiporter subunit E
MRRWLPHPLLAAVLAASWLMLTGERTFAHLLLGIALGVIIPLAISPFLEHLPKVLSARAAIALTLRVTWDIVLANIAVSRLVLGPTGRLRPAFLHVPLALTHPQSIALLASIITMTPGTVSVTVNDGKRELLVHALDCADPEQTIAGIKSRYEQPLLEIFGC